MLYLELEQDTGGKAADTGSAVHKAIATWHGNGFNVTEALAAMREGVQQYPLADLGDAELHFRPYCRDPRNAVPLAIGTTAERKVTLSLPPHENDPTRQPIVVQGTLDQLRQDGAVWDVKTGKSHGGWDMLHDYALQLAAYAVASGTRPGGIIRTYGYRVRGAADAESQPDGVFFESPWSLEECVMMLDAVRIVVAHIRAGEVWAGPGTHCGWCPARGLENCLPRMRELTGV